MTSYGDPVQPIPAAMPDEDGHIHATRRAILWVARGLTYFVYAYVLFVEVILLLGFVLLLGGANPSSSFVEWVYRSLDRVMEPFRGIFTPIELGTTAGNEVESIFETSVLFAMIIYVILAIAISALLGWFTGRINRLDREDAASHQQAALQRAAGFPTAQGGAPAATPVTEPAPIEPVTTAEPPRAPTV